MGPEVTLPLAFLAGLAGAGHCLAMCGGLAGGLFLACGDGRRLLPHVGYHAGRVLAYTLLGAIAAAIGQAIVLTGGGGRGQGILYVVAGALVMLAGAKVAGWLPARFAPAVSRQGCHAGVWPAAGFLNGLLPCALVFSLTLKAATAPSVALGAAWLFAFGLGTVPAMLLASVLAHWLGRQSLRWLRLAAGLLVIALGLQAVLSGTEFFRVMLHL